MECSPPGSFCPWDFPGKNTGVGWPFLLQGIFLTQGSNLHHLDWQASSLPVSHQESPLIKCSGHGNEQSLFSNIIKTEFKVFILTFPVTIDEHRQI